MLYDEFKLVFPLTVKQQRKIKPKEKIGLRCYMIASPSRLSFGLRVISGTAVL